MIACSPASFVSLLPWLRSFLAEGGFIRTEQNLLQHLLPLQYGRWKQISSVVETRVTSPVRRCGNDERIARKRGRESLQSRRHLECRSFNLERRTTTPGLIVPRMGFASSVGCSIFNVAAAPTRQTASIARGILWRCCRRLDAQVGLSPRHAKTARVGDPGLAAMVLFQRSAWLVSICKLILPVA